MSKSKKKVSGTPKGKGFLSLAGEAFTVLGHEIVEGKDKVVEVAAGKITALKEGVGHLLHKKKAVPKKRPKKIAPKAAAKKPVVAAKKAAKKVVAVSKKAAKKPVKK